VFRISLDLPPFVETVPARAPGALSLTSALGLAGNGLNWQPRDPAKSASRKLQMDSTPRYGHISVACTWHALLRRFKCR
jgi:hypothetical protein